MDSLLSKIKTAVLSAKDFAISQHAKILNQKEGPGVKLETILGCDFGQSKIVFLEIQRDEQGIRIDRFHKLVRPLESDKLAEALRGVLGSAGFQTNKIRLSVKGQGVVVRFVQFPKMKIEELQSAITFEAEKYIPFKYDEVVLDFVVLDDEITNASGAKMMNLLLVAVKKEEIYPLIETFNGAGFQVELIDIDALACVNALSFFYPDSTKVAVGMLDVGATTSTLSIIRDGKPVFIRDISYGGSDISKRLKRKLNLSEDDVRTLFEDQSKQTPETIRILKESIANLVADVKVSLDYYLEQVQNSEAVKLLFISGGWSGYHVVLETLQSELGLTVQLMDVIGKIKIGTGIDEKVIKESEAILPVALGLCVREV